MLDRIDRSWRVVATALCFSLFGLGGLVLRFVAFPLLWLTVRQAPRRRVLSRALIRWAMAQFVRVLCALGIMTLEVRGAERLDRRGALVLANHPTLIDVVLLMALDRATPTAWSRVR